MIINLFIGSMNFIAFLMAVFAMFVALNDNDMEAFLMFSFLALMNFIFFILNFLSMGVKL